jgi:hypothetical protein
MLKANASLNTFLLFSFVSSVLSWEEGEEEGDANCRNPAPDCVVYVFVFRGNIICNYLAICHVVGTFGQWPSCVRRCLLCFLTELHVRPPLL